MGRLSLVLICLLIAGCASPTSRLRALADSQGFERGSVIHSGFRMTVFANAPFSGKSPARSAGIIAGRISSRDLARDDVLHIYLEGDGSPWRQRTIIMPDPTPRSPLMLRLMAMDANSSVYVGRPCYNGTSREPGCDSRLWTSDRYSELVVSAMAAAIRRIAIERGEPSLRLIGHSGGGALALLLSERLDRVSDVLTIAGNLDIDAWTDHHGYTPLYGSLNPAQRPLLPASVAQWHLLGGRDAVIPPTIVKRYIAAQPSANAAQIQGFTHGCCWERIWPDILNAVMQGLPDKLPGQLFKRAAEIGVELPTLPVDAPANL